VLYFDVFSYPLLEEELYQHHRGTLDFEEYKIILTELVEEKKLNFDAPFYFSPLSNSLDIQRRRVGNKMALAKMPEAVKWSKIINRFPFVRSVNLSGSIAKNYFDENSDIDYFIVTKANRLWICRSLIVLYWKLLSKENKKKLCTNYFVDETALELLDKNLFTAIELSYLVPIINVSLTHQLLEKNAWVKNYVENKSLVETHVTIDKTTFLKALIEKLLDNPVGNLLDNLFLKITIKRWRKKFPDLMEEDFELQFRSRKNVCKRHTKGFQNKVLKLLENKQIEFENIFNESLR
jgi:hypothetical protein